jgi:Sulfotransferase family
MSPHALRLSVDELMATSRDLTGVDIVDEQVVEPLTVLHRALGKERAQLDAEGARAFERKLLRLLVNRLRMARDVRRHPEIAEQPVEGPVVVMGTARSGTTKTQKVLAASGDFNFLTFWQAFNWASISGEPNEPTEERIAEADAFCRWFDERSPEAKLGHAFAALEPEEDGPLAEGCFVTPTFLGYAEVPAYGRWLAEQPVSIEFEFLRDVMKYLQWQGLAGAGRPWLLKSPSYTSRELDILRVFPDARFVMAHRSPLRTVPSMCTLVGHFRRAYGTSTPDPVLLTEHNAASMDAQLAIRRAHPGLPLLDLRFEDIVGDLPAVVERVYAHAGMKLSDTARSNMRRWDDENAMHKLGTFTYSLDEIGLDEAFVRTRMRGYLEFLDGLEPHVALSATEE